MYVTGVAKPIDVPSDDIKKTPVKKDAEIADDKSNSSKEKSTEDKTINQLCILVFDAVNKYHKKNGTLPDKLELILNDKYISLASFRGCTIKENTFKHKASGTELMFDKTVQLGNPQSFFLIPTADSAVNIIMNGKGDIENWDALPRFYLSK